MGSDEAFGSDDPVSTPEDRRFGNFPNRAARSAARLPSEIKWFYRKPTRRFKNVKEMPFWHYRGVYTDSGNLICGGKWCDAANLVADDGWQEIDARLIELCPDGPAKYKEWNRADAPAASHFFPPITAKEPGDHSAAPVFAGAGPFAHRWQAKVWNITVSLDRQRDSFVRIIAVEACNAGF